MKIYLPIQLDTDDVIEAIVELPDEDIIQFVKDLDQRNQMWKFTIEMFRYFAKEVYKGNSEILDETDGLSFDDLINEIKKEVDE